MKIFHLKSSYFSNKKKLLKTILLLSVILYFLGNLSAQKESNIKLKLDAGLNWKPAERDGTYWDWGLHFSLEPKLKTSKKTFIGLRIQVNENDPTNEKYKPLQFFIDSNINNYFFEMTSTTLISFVPTFDYYFSKNSFNPYLGAGVGIYMLAPSIEFSQNSTSSEELEASIDNQVGFLIRGGVDIWNLTVGLEYNYLPEAEIKTSSGLIIGIVDDSFIALTIGYSFGIGKRLK